MAEELVSICIPTRNQSKYIIDTIDSVFNQSHKNIEIIISDDAGTDDTQAVVYAHINKYYPAKKHILRYHGNQEQLGIGGNFDKAVRMANAEFIVKVDSDDLLNPDFVSKLLQGLKVHPDAGWAHCNVLNITPDKKPIGAAHSKKITGFYQAQDLIRKYLVQPDTCHCVMLRRSAYQKSGGYRKEMLTNEDHLLWLEMIMEGYGCFFSNEILAHMRKYPMRTIMTDRRKRLLNSIPFMQKTIKDKWSFDVEKRLNLGFEKAIYSMNRALSMKILNETINEKDENTRSALFSKAIELNPALFNKMYVYMLSIFPRSVTQYAFKFKVKSRETVKQLIILLKLKVSRIPQKFLLNR